MMGEVIRVSRRTPDIGDFLREAMLSQRFADVALCCPGGQRFLAHRLVLSAASPYLQEVLLAHSKTASHCEPITVILAEVEAPELAALLGFIYTGSATVPRVRLEAFLRAAEALRIRLPPVPVVMTCGEQADCKPEDVKDVKVNPKYLQCDQYPSSDSWYRTDRPPYDDPFDRKESCIRIFPTDERDIPRDASLHDADNEVDPSRSSFGPGCPSVWPIDAFPHHNRTMAEPLSVVKDHGSMMDRSNEFVGENRTVAPGGESSSFNAYQRDTCLSSGPSAEGYGGIDPVERTRTGYETVNCSTERLTDDGILARGSCDFYGKTRNDCVAVIRECSFQSRMSSSSSSLPCNDHTRTFETSNYAQPVEDLSCGESCRWRTARRHVANSVTASPWRQIVRPHHSPKTRPIMPQCHVDNEVQKKPLTPEPLRSSVISMSPKIHSPRSAPRTDGFHAFDVPTNCETINLNNNDSSKSHEMIGGTETKVQEVYATPFASPNQIAPLANTLRSNEIPFQASGNPSTRLLPSNSDSVITNASRNSGYMTQVVSQAPTKPELSHPISRLCDTIESDDKKEPSRIETTSVMEKDEEERIARIFVNSDNNNNNETLISAEVAQRGRSVEEHRCDQCGKTFVTRASLKVHSRTHSGEKPFRCADCGKQFSQLRNYKYHRSVHEGTREFAATCPECGKYFNDRGYLSSHMKIHRNRKEYGCAECGKSFNQRVAYNMHVRIHTGVKPHQCEQCGKAFSRKMLLKQHLRTHSGERPYQCQVCQKAFADRSNMTLHTRLHSGLKPYQCTLCSKAFTKKHHLKTHLNYHTGTKPYSCPNCGLRFSQSSNMRTHFKKCSVNNPAAAAKVPENGERADTDGNTASQVARSPADALTPPNSDQESSILTPISKNVVGIESNA